MPLNVVSNYAANVAHRNLTMTDAEASDSLAKLSIGKRVVSARDDAASMSIGSRMNSEINGLKQAVINTGQANSMLQIADGAMNTVSDMLTRLKTLAIQAGSEHLSSTERQFLDVEFQALLDEVDRVAEDTDFNGLKLLDGSMTVDTVPAGFGTGDGVAAITAQAVASGAFTVGFAADTTAGTYDFTMTAAGGATYAGSIDSSIVSVDTSGNATLDRATTIALDSGTGAGAPDGSMTLLLDTSFDVDASATGAGALGGESTLDLTFKVGTGTRTEDSLSFSLDAVTTSGLGLTGQSIVSAGDADAALEAVNHAIDNLSEFRADVGASQNRLDFSTNNLRISVENTEAARSTLLDLDIAQEMTNFTSKQVLLQSGVAMLAQANQLPQNLLRLLQ